MRMVTTTMQKTKYFITNHAMEKSFGVLSKLFVRFHYFFIVELQRNPDSLRAQLDIMD